jgi:hypothetical protein
MLSNFQLKKWRRSFETNIMMIRFHIKGYNLNKSANFFRQN